MTQISNKALPLVSLCIGHQLLSINTSVWYIRHFLLIILYKRILVREVCMNNKYPTINAVLLNVTYSISLIRIHMKKKLFTIYYIDNLLFTRKKKLAHGLKGKTYWLLVIPLKYTTIQKFRWNKSILFVCWKCW